MFARLRRDKDGEKRKYTYARNSQAVRGEEQRAEEAKERELRDDDPAGAFRGDQFVFETVRLYESTVDRGGVQSLAGRCSGTQSCARQTCGRL